MMVTTKKRIIASILTLFMFVTLTFGQVNLPVFSLSAHATSRSFENTNVLEDLQASEDFNLNKYPCRKDGYMQIINFVEYRYSCRSNMQNDYELYIYVYNPRQIDINIDSYQNKIQMAVAYNQDGTPSQFEKFRLKFCSTIESGEYKYLFYKFKIIDREIDGTYFADRVDSAKRRYDVSGIEIIARGASNATEYTVGGIYFFTGFAKGYGENINSESTLKSNVTNIETLRLEINQTNFRTNLSNRGVNHYNEVNSVYFAVPKRIFDEYGHLQKIRAEWWEYKTKMMTVTSNESFYNEIIKYVGTDVGMYNSNVPIYLYSGYKGQTGTIGVPSYHYYDWCYNKNLKTQYTIFGTPSSVFEANNTSSIMPYAFYAPSLDVDSVFKFFFTKTVVGDIEGTILKEWIYQYKNNLGNGYIDCNGREISVDLFEPFVDEGRTLGYNNKIIDLSDTFDLSSYDSNHAWWDKLWDFGFSWPSTNGNYSDVAPIYEIKAEDLLGEDNDIAEALLINTDEVPKLRSYYAAEMLKGNKVMLFRFANTDYYCAKAYTSAGSTETDCDTYVAQQTVFFDFDIIELTFNKKGTYYVIPAVSSPTDIVNDITAPESEFEWWKMIVSLLMLALLIFLIYPSIPHLISGLFWLVRMPMNLTKLIIKKKRKNKRNKEG